MHNFFLLLLCLVLVFDIFLNNFKGNYKSVELTDLELDDLEFSEMICTILLKRIA